MFGYDMNGWRSEMGFGWLIMLLIVVIFIYFFNQIFNQNKATRDESARDILDKRYANGEIDEEEYKKKKETLK